MLSAAPFSHRGQWHELDSQKAARLRLLSRGRCDTLNRFLSASSASPPSNRRSHRADAQLSGKASTPKATAAWLSDTRAAFGKQVSPLPTQTLRCSANLAYSLRRVRPPPSIVDGKDGQSSARGGMTGLSDSDRNAHRSLHPRRADALASTHPVALWPSPKAGEARQHGPREASASLESPRARPRNRASPASPLVDSRFLHGRIEGHPANVRGVDRCSTPRRASARPSHTNFQPRSPAKRTSTPRRLIGDPPGCARHDVQCPITMGPARPVLRRTSQSSKTLLKPSCTQRPSPSRDEPPLLRMVCSCHPGQTL